MLASGTFSKRLFLLFEVEGRRGKAWRGALRLVSSHGLFNCRLKDFLCSPYRDTIL